MSVLFFALTSVFLVVPKEYHIDCSGWNGAAVVEFDVRITAMDGTVLNSGIELSVDSTSEDARNALWRLLETGGYSGRKVGKGIIVLEGAKRSAIRSVEFKSKDWKPDVRVVLVPEKK